MAEKKPHWSNLLLPHRSYSPSQKEPSSTKKNFFSIRPRSPRPDTARDKGNPVQVHPNGAKDGLSMESKGENDNEKGFQAVGDDSALLLPSVTTDLDRKAERDDDKKKDADRSPTGDSSTLPPTIPTISEYEVPASLLLEAAERDHSIES